MLVIGKKYNVRSGEGTVTITSRKWDVYEGVYEIDGRSEAGTWRANGRVYYNGKSSPRDCVSEVETTATINYGWPFNFGGP